MTTDEWLEVVAPMTGHKLAELAQGQLGEDALPDQELVRRMDELAAKAEADLAPREASPRLAAYRDALADFRLVLRDRATGEPVGDRFAVAYVKLTTWRYLIDPSIAPPGWMRP